MIFSYDESGAPIAIHYRLTGSAENVFYTYYLEKNLQGDVIALYNSSGTKLVGYTYDAWGNCTTTYYNGGGSTGAQFNPFRYRGYYYDSDLGFYYLNSRYYDSRTGRFINADGQLNGGLLGYNQYTYCENNPIMYVDYYGDNPLLAALAPFAPYILGAVAIVAGAYALSTIIEDVLSLLNGIETFPATPQSSIIDNLLTNPITTDPYEPTYTPGDLITNPPIVDTPIGNVGSSGLLETPIVDAPSAIIVYSNASDEIFDTPFSNPNAFNKMRGNQGLKDKRGDFWRIDKLHKDHFDISNSKGQKIREVNFDGIQIWPNGAKNKNKH